MRRLALLVSLTLLLGIAALPVPASGAPRVGPTISSVGLAVGSPGETVSGKAAAGVVHVIGNGILPGTLDPAESVMLTRSMWGGTPAANDRFGASVAVADLNDDNLSDIAIGAPGAGGSGRVYVAYRLQDGTFDPGTLSAVYRQGAGNIPGTSEPGDNFGAVVHIGHTSGGQAWLAIGAPGEDIGAANGAGAVTIIEDDVPSPGFAYSVYQGKSGLPGSPESGDAFGSALADFGLGGLAVGAPGEDIGSAADTGHVVGMAASIGNHPGSGAETGYQQGVGGVPGSNEPGDRFGAALYGRLQNSLTIGAPGEDVGAANGAGAITDIPVPGQIGVTATSWYQGKNGLGGGVESGDAFGAALGATEGGSLIVGVPGEDVGSDADAGLVQLLQYVGGGNYSLTASASQVVHSDTPIVAGESESGDRFGSSIAEGMGYVVVGVPGEDVGAVTNGGAIVLVPAVDFVLVPSFNGQQIHQGTAGITSDAETSDAFGASVSGGAIGTEI
jgi:hypothetical protein